MSKAFVREDDDASEPPPRPSALLPPGTKNYLTPAGAERLREALDALVRQEQELGPPAADDGEAKRLSQGRRMRIQALPESLRTAEVVARPAGAADQVRFGATVTVRDDRGAESRYRIVGVDETDPDNGEVSWLSPIARALLNARVGQKVQFKFPAGARQLEILGIGYDVA